MSINWFPGHMAKTFNNLKNMKNVDLVIEVVDARAIKTSHNNELINLFHQPKMTIALKADLSDQSIHNDENILIGSTTNKQFRNTIIKKIDKILQKRTKSLKAKGLLIPKFHILVVGLPNVGKSSLINFLNPRKNLKIENRPGVTRNNQLIQITPNYYLYDTPGVFVKRVDDLSQGYILSLIGTIKDTVVPLTDVVEWVFQYLQKHYWEQMVNKFSLINKLSFHEFLDWICKEKKFLLINNRNDIERAITYVFNEIKNAKGLRINYEK